MSAAAAAQNTASSDYVQEFEDFMAQLSLDPEKDQVVSELGVLQSIYEKNSIRKWRISHDNDDDQHHAHHSKPSDETVRYEVHINLPPPHDEPDTSIRVLVSLSPSYPASSPPQLQLLSRYIGAFSVDSALFGSVLRTFISRDGVEWAPDALCVFDGMENVRERCANWYNDRLTEEKAGELLREDERDRRDGSTQGIAQVHGPNLVHDGAQLGGQPTSMPDGIDMVEADTITDRKSAFVGRACRVTDPAQVPVILSHLMSDRRISRAAHPIINAWRCKVGGLLHQDNDDDGETAAGGRLAHLLQILDVDDVLVIVTRYFGGIHLGPDRFKHINQAARNALELGGFLDSPEERKGPSRVRKKT